MLHRHRQFTIATAMVLTAVIAILIQLWSKSWLTIVIIDVVAGFLAVEVLRRNLPRAIQKSLEANCKRPDGTWSPRRERAEAKAVRKLQRDLLLVFLVILLSTNAILWYIDTEVVPISVGLDAVSSFQLSPEAWRGNLRDAEQQFDVWGNRKQWSSTELQYRKRMLFEHWPAIVLVGFVWIAAAFWVIKTAYFLALKELSDSIRFRAQQYQTRTFLE